MTIKLLDSFVSEAGAQQFWSSATDREASLVLRRQSTFDPRSSAEIFAALGVKVAPVRDYGFLDKPGPQPHNCDVASTLGEQFRKVYGPAGAPVWTGCASDCPPLPAEVESEDVIEISPDFLETLAPFITTIAAGVASKIVAEVMAKQGGRRARSRS